MSTKPPTGVMEDPFHPLSQGGICHLLMNEGAGNLAYDVSGHGNHGHLNNLPPNSQYGGWHGCKYGSGLGFNDDYIGYVECGNDLISNMKELSILAVVNQRVCIQDGGIFNAWDDGTNVILLYAKQSPHYWRSILKNSNADTSSLGSTSLTPITLDTWIHLAITFKQNGYHKLYINAVEKGSVSVSDYPLASSSGNLNVIGGTNTAVSRRFNGYIDHIFLFNRELSAKEIKQSYYNPFCNLLQVPIWQRYTPAVVGGLSIPVAMHSYRELRI